MQCQVNQHQEVGPCRALSNSSHCEHPQSPKPEPYPTTGYCYDQLKTQPKLKMKMKILRKETQYQRGYAKWKKKLHEEKKETKCTPKKKYQTGWGKKSSKLVCNVQEMRDRRRQLLCLLEKARHVFPRHARQHFPGPHSAGGEGLKSQKQNIKKVNLSVHSGTRERIR